MNGARVWQSDQVMNQYCPFYSSLGELKMSSRVREITDMPEVGKVKSEKIPISKYYMDNLVCQGNKALALFFGPHLKKYATQIVVIKL